MKDANLKERREIYIDVPSAVSPEVLVGSTDSRILGVALKEIDVIMPDTCYVPVCLEQNGFSLPLHSRVGMLSGRWLESTGSKGMLHFGPYLPMREGTYQLTVYGTAKTTGSAWADVASEQGNEIHGRFNLTEKNEISDQILVDAEIALEHDVRDLEVRVYVESEDKVSLRGYSLKLK